ncbi:hypothetical protein QEO94_11245 [Kingella negevensis]|uniref:hypothetical protein n=1 Tax=Kingella negevensis TaxID=1522312 RepID=UPI002542ECEE|nr:hypothetical protein [Kingella negevensis]WII93174.1 hypothetical protein QEO94_11245 [Kingella negevensis]
MNDPILQRLNEINQKQDKIIAKQEHLDARFDQLDRDTKHTAAIVGGVSGTLAGTMVSATISLIKAKLGI